MQGIKLRKLGWEKKEERERLARDIKRKLFSSSSTQPAPSPQSQTEDANPNNNGESVDQIGEMRRMEIAFRRLEDSMERITEKAQFGGGSSMGTNKESGGLGRDTWHDPTQEGTRFGRDVEDIFDHLWRPNPVARWVWIPKLVTSNRAEYPARPEEIKRQEIELEG